MNTKTDHKSKSFTDEKGLIKQVDYLDYFVECSICGCLVKRYHTTMLVLSRKIQCYYCLYPNKYKREEQPDECIEPMERFIEEET